MLCYTFVYFSELQDLAFCSLALSCLPGLLNFDAEKEILWNNCQK